MFWRAHPVWTHLAVDAATIFAATAVLIAVGGTLDRTKLRPAFWFIFLVVGGAIGLIAPGGIIFFIFPPLIFVVGVIASRWWKWAEQAASLAAVLFLYVTWGALLGLLEELLNGGPLWIFAPLGSLLIIPALIEARPLLAAVGLRAAAIMSGAIALVFCACPHRSRLFRRPPATLRDPASHRRFPREDLVVRTERRSSTAPRRPLEARRTAFSDRPRWISDAPATPLPMLRTCRSFRRSEWKRTGVTLRLAANGNEHVDLIAPPDAHIRAAGIDGFVRPIDLGEEGKTFVGCFGRSCDGTPPADHRHN